MRRRDTSRTRLAILGTVSLIVAGLLFAPIPSGHATDGRDFAGFYEATNPSDLGNGTFRVTLTVRIFNYSDADVINATVALSGNVDPEANYGSFSAVSMADKESIKLSADFTVPAEEFNFWQNGGPPSLWIAYADADGNAVQRRIELVLSPGEGQ